MPIGLSRNEDGTISWPINHFLKTHIPAHPRREWFFQEVLKTADWVHDDWTKRFVAYQVGEEMFLINTWDLHPEPHRFWGAPWIRSLFDLKDRINAYRRDVVEFLNSGETYWGYTSRSGEFTLWENGNHEFFLRHNITGYVEANDLYHFDWADDLGWGSDDLHQAMREFVEDKADDFRYEFFSLEDGPDVLKRKMKCFSYLKEHDRHAEWSRSARIAWNIKVYSLDTSGKKHPEQFTPDPQWDARWEAYLDENPDLFWDLAEMGLSFVGSKKTRQYNWTDGLDGCNGKDYTLYQTGRSGGWLELHEFDGQKVEWSDFLADWIEHDVEWLEQLVVLCRSLDNFDASREMEFQYTFHREMMEEEWAREKP